MGAIANITSVESSMSVTYNSCRRKSVFSDKLAKVDSSLFFLDESSSSDSSPSEWRVLFASWEDTSLSDIEQLLLFLAASQDSDEDAVDNWLLLLGLLECVSLKISGGSTGLKIFTRTFVRELVSSFSMF